MAFNWYETRTGCLEILLVDSLAKGVIINYAREGAGREIQNFAKTFHSPCQILIFFHSPFEKLYLVSWPISAAHALLGTRKSMNCQVNAISKNTVVTHLLY